MKALKTLNLILTIMSMCTGMAQDYKLDKLVKSTFSTEIFPNQQRTHLFNSKDYSYHMQIYSQNDSLKASILDTAISKVHLFYIDQSDSLTLRHLKTLNLNPTPNNYSFEFSEKSTREDKNEITFEVYKKKKRRIAKYTFNIQETDEDFFSIFKLSATETFIFSDIVAPRNFIVLKAKGRNVSGNSVAYELISIEAIEFSVSIPQKNKN